VTRRMVSARRYRSNGKRCGWFVLRDAKAREKLIGLPDTRNVKRFDSPRSGITSLTFTRRAMITGLYYCGAGSRCHALSPCSIGGKPIYSHYRPGFSSGIRFRNVGPQRSGLVTDQCAHFMGRNRGFAYVITGSNGDRS